MAIFNPDTSRKKYYTGRLTFCVIFLIGLLIVGGISWQQGFLDSILSQPSSPKPTAIHPQAPQPPSVIQPPQKTIIETPVKTPETSITEEASTPQPDSEIVQSTDFLLQPDSDCTEEQAKELQQLFRQTILNLDLPQPLQAIIEHPDFLTWVVHGVNDFSEGLLTIHPTLHQLCRQNNLQSSFLPQCQTTTWIPHNCPETAAVIQILNWLDNEQNLTTLAELYHSTEPLLAYIYKTTISDDRQFRQKLHRTFIKITDYTFPKPTPQLRKIDTIFQFADLRQELKQAAEKFLFRRGESLLTQLQQKIKEINAKISQQP